jgi:general secretion pathway protein D
MLLVRWVPFASVHEGCVRRLHGGYAHAALALFMLISLAACQTIERITAIDTPARSATEDGKTRPFGAYSRLADPSGPAPIQAGTTVLGSGEFVGDPALAGASRTPRRSERGSYTLNLIDATVAEAAAAVLGDIFGVNYTVDSKLDSRITVQTSSPATRREIAELFEAALRGIGAAIVQNGSVYRVVTADQAAMGARFSLAENIGQVGIGNSLKVVSLKYIAAAEMKRILDPIASFGGVVRVDGARNALVLSGTEQEIASMEEAISVFDVDVMRGMSFAVVPVRAVEPEAVVEDLNNVFGANKEGPMSGMVQFVPNKRLKTILVISKQPQYLAEAQQWIRRLDEQAIGTRRQFYTYVLRNRQAKEVVEVLNSVFASETAVPDPAARAGVAAAPPRVGVGPSATTMQTALTATAAPPVGQAFDIFGGVPFGRAPSRSLTILDQTEGGIRSDESGGSGATGFGAGGGDGEPRIKIVADPSQNALLVLASDADYKRVERVIANLDVIPNQVLIEATIVEVTLNDDLRFGVRWFFQNKSGKHTGIFSSAIDGAVSSVFPGFSYLFKNVGAQVTLNALNDVTRVNVLASPSLMVLDKKTATLQIGDQVPITTQSAISVITPGAPIVNSVAYKDTGVILSITPRVNESGRVLLDIEQEVSTVTRTTSSNIDSPTFGRRRVKTTVVVNDGEGVTLGGLIQDRATQAATQIPILGDIPIIGNAFKDKQNLVEKTELVIMLTPRVVRDLNEAQEVTAEYRRKVEAFAPSRDQGRRLLHNAKRTLQ